MSNRNYISLSADELDDLAKRNWSSVTILHAIVEECGYRTTKRARNIRARVQQRVQELQGKKGGHSHDQARNVPADPFVKVGLHPSAPDFVVKAVHTAWRKHLHPDRYAAEAKASAEEEFKQIEIAFDKIVRSRAET